MRLAGKRTLAERPQQFDVHPNRIAYKDLRGWARSVHRQRNGITGWLRLIVRRKAPKLPSKATAAAIKASYVRLR